jgi:hypothetical protein
MCRAAAASLVYETMGLGVVRPPAKGLALFRFILSAELLVWRALRRHASLLACPMLLLCFTRCAAHDTHARDNNQNHRQRSDKLCVCFYLPAAQNEPSIRWWPGDWRVRDHFLVGSGNVRFD